ncbi:MAG TPA: ester cyclase [Ignavibacteriaceae bacterium]|nr:ester cyclase [Ignavibacteriaceae bacterium]
MYKKYLILFILPVVIIFYSCQSNQMNEKAEKQKEVVAKIFEIFDNGNVDELNGLIAENSVDHQLDTSITKEEGLAGTKELFRYFHRIFPDMKTTIHSMAVSNDTVFVYSTSTGTTSEPFMGMPVNHKHTISGVDIVRFENEKAMEHWGFIDIAALNNMMKPPMQSDTSIIEKDK